MLQSRDAHHRHTRVDERFISAFQGNNRDPGFQGAEQGSKVSSSKGGKGGSTLGTANLLSGTNKGKIFHKIPTVMSESTLTPWNAFEWPRLDDERLPLDSYTHMQEACASQYYCALLPIYNYIL